MKYIREQDVEGERIGAPYQRVIRMLITPENMGIKNMAIDTSSVDPGFTSNAHSHEEQEEIFHSISGRGRMFVKDSLP